MKVTVFLRGEHDPDRDLMTHDLNYASHRPGQRFIDKLLLIG